MISFQAPRVRPSASSSSLQLGVRGGRVPFSSDSRTAPPGSHRSSGHDQCPTLRRHSLRPSHPSARQVGPGWIGRNVQYTSLGGTLAVWVPWRSCGFSQWRIQWGTGGTRGEPMRREQVRPEAPYKGCDIAHASQDIQWAPGPGFFSACLRDSLILRAGPAAGPRSPHAAARSSQVLLRVARQGPAGTELTPRGGGHPQRRDSRSRATRSLQSGGVPAGAPGVRASHALILQSSAHF
ncbi:hypothetical protein NDU88_008164 [Pleurodeles waltl]|uniref:Uncharacterized protein n=1 Tax=Pleurodeles waltl TaxID=8319 RepID=A0AAV7VVP3_PLEWA|nr:hypothetical protein NDU88_008164 [Pleurodeles waltl]